MFCQRDQTGMQKVGELYLFTKDHRDETDLVTLADHRLLRSRDETDLVTLADHRLLRSVGGAAPWSPQEDEMLRLALAKYVHVRPVPWLDVAREFFPRKPLDEVFKLINKFLQDIQGELLSQAVHLSASRTVIGPASVGPSHQLVRLQPRDKNHWNPNQRENFDRNPNQRENVDRNPNQRDNVDRNPNQRENVNRNPNPRAEVEEEERTLARRSVPQPWTEEEKENFVKGIEAHGWGSWKLINETFVPTRTPLQLASHAQKIKKKDPISSTNLKKRKYDDVASGTQSESPAPPEEYL